MEDACTLIRAQPEYNNRRITKTGSDYDDHVYTYDAVGNLTGNTLSQHRGSVTSGSPRNFVYDAFGRLVAVTGIVTDEGPTSIAKYRYNGLGFRIMSQEDDRGTLDAAENRYMMYDERWRVVAAFRDQDAAPKESYVYHAAGWNGSGDAAYIDSVILRDRDNTSCGSGCDPRFAASDGVLEERRFYCQNWRADVVAITAADGTPVETVRYSAYGEPTAYPMADLNMDGKVDSTDLAAWNYVVSGGTAVDMAYSGDIDFDGYFDFTSNDDGVFFNSYDANLGKSGKGRLSTPGVDNRIGYAGYQWDQAVRGDHVRFRVYLPEIGRWTRRDPLGYIDGPGSYAFVRSCPMQVSDPTAKSATPIIWPRPKLEQSIPESLESNGCGITVHQFDDPTNTDNFGHSWIEIRDPDGAFHSQGFYPAGIPFGGKGLYENSSGDESKSNESCQIVRQDDEHHGQGGDTIWSVQADYVTFLPYTSDGYYVAPFDTPSVLLQY